MHATLVGLEIFRVRKERFFSSTKSEAALSIVDVKSSFGQSPKEGGGFHSLEKVAK